MGGALRFQKPYNNHCRIFSRHQQVVKRVLDPCGSRFHVDHDKCKHPTNDNVVKEFSALVPLSVNGPAEIRAL